MYIYIIIYLYINYRNDNILFNDVVIKFLHNKAHLFVPCMYYMINYLDIHGFTKMELFPQITSHIPNHMQIDTVSMIDLLHYPPEGRNRLLRHPSSADARLVWNQYFDLASLKNPFHKQEMVCFSNYI